MDVARLILLVVAALSLATTAQADYLPAAAAAEAALWSSAPVVQARGELEAQILNSQSLQAGREEWVLAAEAAYRRLQLPPQENHTEGSVSLSRPLRLPSRTRADYKLATSLVDHSKAQLGEMLHESGRRLLTLWFEWLGKYSQSRLWQAQIKLGEQQLETVKTRIKVGEAPRSEQVNAEAALAQIRLQQQVTVMQELQARRQLGAEFPGLQIAADEFLPLPAAPEGTAENYVTLALAHNHELMRARYKADMLQAEADQFATRDSIDPSVGAFYKNEGNGSEHVFGLNLVLTLPGSARRSDQQAALRLASAAQKAKYLLEQRLRNEALSLFESATAQTDNWRQAEQAAQALTEAARLSERAYSLGEGNLDQVLLNRRLAIEGQLTALQARVSALATHARLRLDAHQLWSLHQDIESH